MAESGLVAYLRDRTGESLRGVVRYDNDAIDILYLREDLREIRPQSQIDHMLARVVPESNAREERSFPFGDLYVSVHRFEEAILMHFPTGDYQGVVVSLEPETARRLNKFTTECLKRIQPD